MSTLKIIGLVYVVGLPMLFFWDDYILPILMCTIFEFIDSVVQELHAAHDFKGPIRVVVWIAYPLVIIAVLVGHLMDLGRYAWGKLMPKKKTNDSDEDVL